MTHLLRRSCLFWVVLAILALVAYCAKKPQSIEPQSKKLKSELLLGEFGTMTGPEKLLGVSTHQGIMLAVEEANDLGGIKGRSVRVITYDDHGRSDQAITAVTKLITQDKVVLILGEVASSRSIAAAPIAQRYKVPMISPSSTNPRVTEIGRYIFRGCFVDPFQGMVMARFAKNHLKLKTAAILQDRQSDYSTGLATYFAKEFEKQGGRVVSKLAYSSGDIDFSSQLRVIRRKKPDLIYIPGYHSEVGRIAAQAREMQYKGVFLGGDGWETGKLAEAGSDAIVGGYFTSHYSARDKNVHVQNFVAKYKAKYNQVPNSLAAMGYDTGRVVLAAARRAPSLSSESLRDALATTRGFQGVTGVISIDESGNAHKSAVILRVDKGGEHYFVTTINP